MVAEFVRQQQGPERLGQPCDVLSDVDERDREVARRIEDRQTERTDQDDVAGRCAAGLPKRNGPSQDPDRQRNGHRCMSEPQLFEISKAAPSRGQLSFYGRIKAVMLKAQSAK